MKKWICIILTCFLLISVPVRGYAVSPVVWGIGEEVILPFLLALLGVQATETIDSYDDLVTYNEKIKGSLIEKTSGLAGMEQVQEWLLKVVNGVIDTDSIIWDKLYEYAVENYVAVSGSGTSVDHSSGIGNFQFTMYQNTLLTSMVSAGVGSFARAYSDAFVDLGNRTYLFASSNNVPYRVDNYYQNEFTDTYYPTSVGSYTYNGLTVYYAQHQFSGTMTPVTSVYDGSKPYRWMEKISWLMVYGGYTAPVAGDATYSDAFTDVLTASEKDDIIDGTSVVQLYNPDALQNGLEIIPGGDPEDDPNLKKIPFAVTADWWNFLQQFGQGSSSNQYVNAYNALNGLDGTSIGRISDAYDSLGIANIVGSAANAAEGIVNLTDNNIYPNSQTVADSVNATIPQILDPEAPDSGIDNESPNGLYKLPDLRDYFPFCIPFDLIHLLSILAADPVTPEFVIKLSDGNHEASTIASLEVLESVSQIVRNFELAGFCLGLILITRGIIRG